MRSDHALRYLLLKHLWRLRSFTDRRFHSDIAKSLRVEQVAGAYIVSWTHRDGPHRVECPTDRFLFYKRGDVPDQKGRSRSTPTAHDNEQAARQLAAEILGVPLPPHESRQSVPLYGDVWRWPLVCGLGALAGFVTSRSLLPFVLAGTAILESRVRTYRLYFLLLAALVLGRYTTSAIVVGMALAGITWLGSTNLRGRIDAPGYLILAYLSWHFRPDSHPAPTDWIYILPAMLVATCVLAILWLSFEGPRLSILLAPVLAVSLLADGHSDLSLMYLSVCLVYAAWLTVPMRLRRFSRP